MARTRVMSSESSRPTMGGRADRAPDGTREKRVLVVDDETVLRQLVAEVLEFEGYLVDAVIAAPAGHLEQSPPGRATH